MSQEQRDQVALLRHILAERIASQRRAYRELRSGCYRDDRMTMLEINKDWSKELFTVREFIYDIEWHTGLPILSKTRAEWRREGKHVN